MALPITTWRFKTQPETVRHLGPMSQDFRAAFGRRTDDKTITQVDVNGVALASIQGLNAKREAQIANQAREIASLRAQHAAEIAELRRALELLAARVVPSTDMAASR